MATKWTLRIVLLCATAWFISSCGDTSEASETDASSRDAVITSTDTLTTAAKDSKAQSEGQAQKASGTSEPAPKGSKKAATVPSGQKEDVSNEAVATKDAFDLVSDAKDNFYTLPTFGNDIDDQTVSLSSLQPWKGVPADYLGEYFSSLENDVTGMRVLGAGRGKLTLIFSFSTEVAQETGEIEFQDGEKAMTALPLLGTTLSWSAAQPVYVSQGQFVTWQSGTKTYYGFLTKGRTSSGKAPFILFRLAG